MNLSSKERVRLAFSYQEPDRVPINYFCNPGIDGRLKAHFGLKPADDEGLRQALQVDFRSVNPPYTGPELHPQVPDRLVDLWGVRMRWIEHGSGGYWDYCDFPLKDADLDFVLNYPMPDPDDYDYAAVVEAARHYQDYWVTTGSAGLGDIINRTAMFRNMEQVLVDLMTEDEACLAFIDRRLKIEVEILSRTLEAAKGLIDMVWMGEDLGTQKGPMISKRLYRKQLRPRHQQIIDCAKSFNLPVIVHSCGSSSWVYEDFIEMGVNAVDTLQPEAKDMSPAYLVEHFGGRLAFHGCISTTGALAFGTVDDVRQHVRETLEIMMPGGGYALSPTHQIQDNSPTENVVAMYAAALEMGKYT
ncbi:MAG: uroporphyrinogen decarboxylase family protein [Anaerolineae bacterium]|nr:uroporphyrinogen decarboxylase family protein [Anaerolineae bacterium]